MKLAFHPFDLALRHTFTTARGSHKTVPVLVVQLEHDGITGWGETSPSRFFGQTVETVRADLEALAPWLAAQDPLEYRLLLERAAVRLGGNAAALCALDLALHDWIGKRLGVPLWRLLGLAREVPPTSYTIGIDTIPAMTAKLREVEGFPVIKIKLGTPEDVEIVRALRSVTPALFRVDANTGWGPEETIEKSKALADLGVEFIEQPMHPDRNAEMRAVIAGSALPMIADESSVAPPDVPALHGLFNGINIKLVKCGGIQPALKMIAMARTLGMKIMFGCMIETSICCTAAAHLGALADYLDLDGPLLIDNDPFTGMRIENGAITLPETPGLGVAPRT